MQHIVQHLLHNRRFWRRVRFSELSELYISMSLKSLALSLVAIFIPVYLHELGYTLVDIAFFYCIYFLFRVPLNLLAGWLTARSGPKHVISYSYVALLLSLAAFFSLPEYGWPLWLLAIIQALFNGLFFIGYHVDFSKIEDEDQAGKELSIMNVLVRIAASIGPLVGGVLATFYGVHIVLGLAIILVLLAVWPLMQSAEPVHKRRSFSLASLHDTSQFRNSIALMGEAVARQSTLVVWPLFLSVFIFTDNVYAKVGFVTSLSIVTSLLATRYFGRLIDNAKSKLLLNGSVSLGAVINPLRAFVQNLGTVSLVNITTEFVDSAQILVFSKGLYGEAEASDDRIGYITVMEIYMAIIRSIFWLGLLAGFVYLGERWIVFALAFWASGIATAVMSLQRFRTIQ